MPSVSVILTSYNHQDHVGEAIDSVLRQSFEDFELIVIDDCSEDDSDRVIRSFDDPRIRYIRNQKRERTTLVNNGINKYSSGRYIAIHHSDDLFEPDKLEKQVAYLEQHTGCGAVFSHASLIDTEGRPWRGDDSRFRVMRAENRDRHEWLRLFFFAGNCLWHPSALIRRECYEKVGCYPTANGQMGDYDLWVRLCQHYDIHIIQQPLISYRVRDDQQNQSGVRKDSFIRGKTVVQEVLRHYLKIDSVKELQSVFPELAEEINEGRNHIPFLLARNAVRRGGHRQQVFGIQLLLELFRDPAVARQIGELHGFTPIDLIELTGQVDVYQYWRVQQLEQELASCREMLAGAGRA